MRLWAKVDKSEIKGFKIMNHPHLIKTGESGTVEFKEKIDERTIESAVALIQNEVE